MCSGTSTPRLPTGQRNTLETRRKAACSSTATTMRLLTFALLLSSPAFGQTQADSAARKVGSAQTRPSCTYFTVVTKDRLNNVQQGLSTKDVKWFQKDIAKKYPGLCYADPANTVPLVFYIIVTPAAYHGTQVLSQTSTHSDPVSETVTEQDGSTSQVDGTVETTTTTSTAVPYSVDYGIFTLTLERRLDGGNYTVLHRFQQKGLYNTLYGIPLGGRGHHPVRAVIEDAAKWISRGGLTDPTQSVLDSNHK